MLPGSMSRPIVARIDADRVTDERAVSQLGLLIRASGIDPAHLILELDGWGAGTLGEEAHTALRELGVGGGVAAFVAGGRRRAAEELSRDRVARRIGRAIVVGRLLEPHIHEHLVRVARVPAVPQAVGDVGRAAHNEVDDDGNAVMQEIDQSKLVPLLTAALQEAIAKIETLETQNASLEARLTALEGGS